jgi:hypothetical protein
MNSAIKNMGLLHAQRNGWKTGSGKWDYTLSLFQNSVSFGQALRKTGQKPGFSIKSREMPQPPNRAINRSTMLMVCRKSIAAITPL